MSRAPPAPNNKVITDKLYEAWLKSLSEKTASRYRYGLIAYCEHTGKTCSALIKEAHEDYINRVAPWELRHIKAFEGFIQSIKGDPELSNWTKLGFINAVRHFYRFNKIPVEGLSKANIPAMATERYLDLPGLKLDDIRKAVLSCGVDEKLTKALILTFLSSGQAQAEVQHLQGRHLKNIVNNVAVVNMTRGKTNRRYTFFIGSEALTAIHEYKDKIGDNDFVFTQKTKDKPLNDTYIGTIFKRLASKLGWERSYFQPHRFRHYFKSQLSGSMDNTFIEYLLGHKLPGVESNYFLGNQEKMLEQYVKNQDKLTIFTDAETLQKQYDELKQENSTLKSMFTPDMIQKMIDERVSQLLKNK
ncbi:Tyrosine recombinase XerD [uncultured archaeon]|nr:Tyrosine recombinase XerD [uncultured archaeon]